VNVVDDALRQRFETRAAWRAWLVRNHATEQEIWLVFFKRHTGKPGLAYEEAIEEALCFGWIDGILKRIAETVRLLAVGEKLGLK
jgi:uncharacterized protein YdeI (YjbR/CyaY-like superfamily)